MNSDRRDTAGVAGADGVAGAAGIAGTPGTPGTPGTFGTLGTPGTFGEDPLKQRAQKRLEECGARLIQLSEQLHADPETAWQEHRSSRAVAEVLRDAGFAVEQPYLELDTAFRAVYGSGDYTVGFLAEYDALPGVGHACGHNLIAAMSTGAGIALASVADELGVRVEVLGTPAEEGGGGKIEMIRRGAFKNLNLAMMAHPAQADVAEAKPFAVAHWHVAYDGRAAHAAAYPWRGVNANDAFVIAQTALALLRQQLPATVRVHGIQTVGGEAPNVIPERTEGRWYVRAETTEELLALEERVTRCFEAGALATGAKLTITSESERYSEMRTDERVLDWYRANAGALGRSFAADPDSVTMNRASTDMGNVSQLVPAAIHPYIGVATEASNHQPAFADACVGKSARQCLRDGATALAWTAIDAARERAR